MSVLGPPSLLPLTTEVILSAVVQSGSVSPPGFLEVAATAASVHKEIRPTWIKLLLLVCREGSLPRDFSRIDDKKLG